jgi:hypothetical protein
MMRTDRESSNTLLNSPSFYIKYLVHAHKRKRQPMAAYRFGGLEDTLFRPGERGLMSMIG